MSIEIRQDVLLAETHHRMMNTLALMASSLRREFAPFQEASLRNAISRHERMIVAYGELHSCLTINSRRNSGAFATYLSRLCSALDSAILRPLGHSCTIHVEDGFEPTCPPERIGLIVAELVTNAAKHAFANKTGKVMITLSRRENSWKLDVMDDGKGMARSGCGVGANLIDTLVAAVGGTLTMRTAASGTSFTVEFGAEVRAQ